jgi:NADH-quinone oxidoreductase subunit N
MLYGSTGTLSFTELPAHLNGNPLQIFSFILLIAGFGFKISAVPFHLWTADVYEGAPVAVTSIYLLFQKEQYCLYLFRFYIMHLRR